MAQASKSAIAQRMHANMPERVEGPAIALDPVNGTFTIRGMLVTSAVVHGALALRAPPRRWYLTEWGLVGKAVGRK
jgi:hypothetical protein